MGSNNVSPTQALREIDAYNGDILDLDQSYGKVLCLHISGSEQNYEFKRYIAKCGESIAIKAFDAKASKDKQNILLKFSLPDKITTKGNLNSKFRLKWILLPEKERDEPNILSRPIQRFLDSAYIQKSIWKIAKQDNFKHGYIPEVYQIGKTNFPFVAMEFIDNFDLIIWLKTQSELTRLTFFLNLVKLVEKYLHNHEIAHCDIAPSNILIKDGLPVLIDFGMHKNFAVDKSLTRSRDELGKPMYRSPEMASDPTQRDYRTDIFMLGRILWIAWKADVPKDIRLLKGSSSSHLFPMEELPIYLRSIFNLATYEDKEKRYQKLEAMREDMETVLSEFLPKFRKKMLEGDNRWKEYVKDKANIPTLEKIFSIMQTD